jgi:Domain of unknown function (DUF1992)
MADRHDRLRTLDEEIARHLEEAAKSGELKAAKGYGQPLPVDTGYEETPAELRMGFKILKDAGVAPPEIAWFHERAELKAAIAKATEGDERDALRRRLVELEQKISLRLEVMRSNASF